jgi:NAD+ diphosphatase
VKSSSYPETVNLAFNFSSVRSDFEFCAPGSEAPAGDGNWVIIQGNNSVFEESGHGPKLLYGALPDWLVPQEPAHFVGIWRGRPLRAINISSKLELEPPLVSEPFNSTDERIDIQTLTLAGLAKQILHWESQSRNCSRCGEATVSIPGSWGKRCISCKSEHYPHIHPCSIILVKRGNELLLTRKEGWPAGRYSLVAGFLDLGESLEECAIREVKEETGIDICNVRYVGSQNWPFPAQIMAGFVADYAGGEIIVEPHELEDARWFQRDALPNLPTRRSIARWIIENFK